MPKTEESKAIDFFIMNNWNKISDREMGRKVGISSAGVNARRRRLGIARPQKTITSNNQIADMLEMFCNGSTVSNIAKKHGRHHNYIGKIIESHFFYKKRSYNTITLVLDSKINYGKSNRNKPKPC